MSEEKRFKEESARTIIKEINTFVRTSPLNRMPGYEDMRLFDKPLVRFADGDDPIFKQYKTIIGEIHMTPREVLARDYEKKPVKVSVVSWILPITATTRKSNGTDDAPPWSSCTSKPVWPFLT